MSTTDSRELAALIERYRAEVHDVTWDAIAELVALAPDHAVEIRDIVCRLLERVANATERATIPKPTQR